MAPSATETITGTERASSTFKVHAGDYKEITAAKFREEDERKGTGEHAPASVCTPPTSVTFPVFPNSHPYELD